MTESRHRVGIVVNPNFAERIAELARTMHTSVVESPFNTPVVQRISARETERGHSLESGVTSVAATEHEPVEEICAGLARKIDLHHGEYSRRPPWSEIAVVGVELTQRLRSLRGNQRHRVRVDSMSIPVPALSRLSVSPIECPN
ncbi:MAG: hypothetical protein ABR567_16885 [Myxococcales bacterium]|nr:hypothetical protein [Myxococcales bacterium]